MTQTITNNGTLPGPVTVGSGYTLINTSGATIVGSGFAAVYGTVSGPSTVVNYGVIDPALYGVFLAGGGYVNNAAGASIYGSKDGVLIAGGAGSVVNAGVITGSQSYGVALHAGGTASNVSGGFINGGIAGFYAGSGSDVSTITNAGVLSGYAGALVAGQAVVSNVSGGRITGSQSGINLGSGASATIANAANATISGQFFGIAGQAGSSETVINTGTISGIYGLFIYNGAVTNVSGGTIVGNRGGIQALVGGSATVENAGFIGASGGNAIYLPDGGSVTNQSGGTISARYDGILATGLSLTTVFNAGTVTGVKYGIALANGTVVNAGTIIGVTAVRFAAGGANRLVLLPGSQLQGPAIGGNAIGGTIVSTLELASGASTGTLSHLGEGIGGFAQVSVDAGAYWALDGSDIVGSGITFTNAGTLAGPVTLGGGGMLINAAGATVVSSGTAAVYGGLALNFGVPGGPGTVVNYGVIDPALYGVYLPAGGTVTDAAGAVIEGTNTGVRIAGGAGTVIDAGMISGGTDAVSMAAGFANRMVLLSGYSVSGLVDGGNTIGSTIVSTLELASAATTGALSGFGTNFVDFSQIAVDAGATWAIDGSDPIAAGVTLTNAGTLTGAVSLVAGGALTNAATGTITRTGANFGGIVLQGAGQSTVTNAGLIAGGNLFGIYAGGAAAIINTSGGTITGYFDAIAARNSGAVTIDNAGLVSASDIAAIYLTGGTISNAATGTITGGRYAVRGSGGGAVTVVNAGLISNTQVAGVELLNGGNVTNLAGATIAGGAEGLYGSPVLPTTVFNAGVILGTQKYGAVLHGVVTNATSGTISGYGDGIRLSASTLMNAGLITGGRRYGVYLSGGGVISNASTGTIGGGMYAVRFAPGQVNRLVLAPGSHLLGIADGGDTISSTLELASAASAGTIRYLGLEFRNFGTVAVDAGATWDFAEGTAFSTPFDNTIAGTLINDGGIVLDPSTLLVGDLLGSGSITIQSGSTLEVTGTIAATETIVFQGTNAYLHLDNPTHAYGSVIGFAATDSIDLKGIDPTSVTGGLTFGAGSYVPLNAANPTPIYAAASSDGALVTPLCFLPDTLIKTPSGEVKVQDLAVGDLVATLSGAQRPIAWIGNGSVLATRGKRGPATPVIVRKHAFAADVPSKDLRITKGHAFWFDCVLIPVEFLVNHRSIEWDDRAQEVALFHVELDTHDVLIANGAPAESYRDDGNRWLFRNANNGWSQPAKPPCAPVLTGGPIVDATWRRLLDRAGPRPGVPVTDAADLHLVVDGVRIDTTFQRGDWHLFRLPRRLREVRIASRAASPQELGLARDPRVLGVAVRRILLSGGGRIVAIEADDARLTDGFHGFEPDLSLRWTDGWAAVPGALFAGFEGALELVLWVGGTARYVENRADDRAVG